MRPYMFALLLTGLVMSGQAVRADEPVDTAADEAKLKAVFLGTDGPSLVDFLRQRAKGEASRDELQKLLEDLASPEVLTRHKASARLVAIGAPAIPFLRLAAREIDTPEVSAQAKALLTALEEDPGALSIAVIRLLGANRPAGAAEALLAFLPHAETDAVLEEIRTVLTSVAREKGKPTKVLLDALADKNALRRATAVQALCAGGIPEPRDVFRQLLNDPKPSVRLRAALALAQASDPKAVSTLITLLADLPLEQAKEVETFLVEMAGDLAPKVTLEADTLAREKYREAWAKWWLETEGTGLLDEIKKRTLSEDDLSRVDKLIEQLGDDVFEDRQKAEEELKKMGAKILPLLRLAKNNPDLEIRNRTQKLVESIEADKTPPLAVNVPRLIALRKPKGAVETILAYLPFADDPTILDELQLALNAVAYSGDKPHPALVKAVSDKASSRRAAAGVALCAGPLGEQMPLIRKLLTDKEPAVRAKVALALAEAKEPEAVPVMIKLIGETNSDLTAPLEDYLVRLARDAGPKDLDGDDKRKQRSEAWAKWWESNKDKVVLLDRNAPAARTAYLGFTLLVKNGNNEVAELDKDNKERWKITGLLGPWDAQWVGNNRVLVAEYNANRVTERDIKTGEIKWQVDRLPSNVQQAERLKNGNTFIVCRNALIEVDKAGKERFRLNRPGFDVYTARRLPNGQIVLVTTNRQIIRFDKNGKELKSFSVPEIHYFQNEILDNGHVLVPLGWRNQVVEYNTEGKEVMRLNANQPTHAVRLPNGHTLVLSQNWPNPVIEFDKKNQQISSYNTNSYAFRVKRR